MVMTKLTGAEVEGLNAAVSVGVNVAVKECVPAAGVTFIVAVTEPVPMDAPPSKNSNVPGVPVGLTDAVSVTGVPAICGLAGEVARVVVVLVAKGAVMMKLAAVEVDGANAVVSVGVNTPV